MRKIVVTGGAGFIGSALMRALLRARDVDAFALDNLSSGKAENLEGVDGARLAVADIRDYGAIAPLVEGADTVFHLAAIPSVPRSIHDPIPSHDVNINGTFNVLRACHAGRVRRVVYAASSSAYGDTEVLPKTESMRPAPLSPYAAQKLMGEYYAQVFSCCFGVETVSLRFFNVFGPRQDPSSPYSGVLSLFNKAILERRAPVIFGDGEQSRDFTFVEDVAELCMKASDAPSSVSGKFYNAGNGNRYTLNETWALLQKIEGVSIPAQYGPARAGDVRHSQADTAAAVRDLGHAPRFSFEAGLRLTLEWYRASLKS
ncbi:MAG: SDR family oxidoreductase [Acidobacteria bacterium]|nr:SDR family oxidoreductase [Acidobacteriota bacterium]